MDRGGFGAFLGCAVPAPSPRITVHVRFPDGQIWCHTDAPADTLGRLPVVNPFDQAKALQAVRLPPGAMLTACFESPDGPRPFLIVAG